MTTLREVVSWIVGAADRELSMKTVLARKPWTPDAQAQVVELDDEGNIPSDGVGLGLEYFLEASVAGEALDGLRKHPAHFTVDSACALLIYFAENDAYPEWVNNLGSGGPR